MRTEYWHTRSISIEQLSSLGLLCLCVRGLRVSRASYVEHGTWLGWVLEVHADLSKRTDDLNTLHTLIVLLLLQHTLVGIN